MLRPINLPLETRRECVAGRIIHVGERGNELEGMQRMCSAEHGPLKWMGSSQKRPLTCPVKHLPPREMAILQPILMLWLSVTTGYGHVVCVRWFMPSFSKRVLLGETFSAKCEVKEAQSAQPSVPQWELPVALRALT